MQTSVRKQLNLRVDTEFLVAVGELQRLDTTDATAPTMTEAIRRAVMEKRDRLRDLTKRVRR